MLMAVCDAHMKVDSSVFATMVAGMLLIEKLLKETFADLILSGCQWGLFLLAHSAKTETLCPRLEKKHDMYALLLLYAWGCNVQV